MLKHKKKILPVLLVGGILAGNVSFFAKNVNAAAPATQAVQNLKLTAAEEKQVDELADQLKFLNEEALIVDKGKRTFDFKKIEAKYGSDFATAIKNDIVAVGELNATKKYDSGIKKGTITQYNQWTDCMISALKDHFGVSMVQAALEGGLWTYLQKKAYKEAAKLLVKFAVGLNAATLAATLIYYGGVCTYKYG